MGIFALFMLMAAGIFASTAVLVGEREGWEYGRAGNLMCAGAVCFGIYIGIMF